MPRGERPLDEGDGPLLRFAADLRRLRERAGSPVYRELSQRAHYSTAVLSEAAGGRKLPSLAVTLAYVTACDGDPEEWEQRWREVAAELLPVESRAVIHAPYLGSAAFEQADAERFFGRAALVDELAAAVGEHRLVCVHGASGAGTSSLLRAGLAANSRHKVVVFTPGPHPIEECAVRLAVVAGWSAPRLRDELAADPANLHLRIRQAATDGELLLVVDQFEEVFTRCRDASERDHFIAALAHAANADTSRCRIVLGLRADHLAHVLARTDLRDVHPVPVRAMTADELREAATKPALVAGLTLETALVARIIADAGDRSRTLPLVSQALHETWHRRQGMTLTLAAYDEAGGIRHAIARTAETAYLALEPDGREIARQLFLRLVAFGDGAEDTTRRIERAELDDSEQTEAVLADLVRLRLVTTGRHGIELTHEALLLTWPRLREWLSEDRPGLRTHRQLTEAAAAWAALDFDPGALYRGLRLLIAEDWINRAGPVLSARERRFFDASRYAERSRLRFDRKRTRRLRQLVVLLGVLLLATTAAGLTAWFSSQGQLRAQAAVNVDAQVPALMHVDRYLAGQLALAAYRLNPCPQTLGRLLEFAVEQHVAPGGGVQTIAVDAKATLMASSATNGVIALTEFASDGRIDIPGSGVAVDSLALSADGKLLAASYVDGSTVLWDITAWNAPVKKWSHSGNRVVVSFTRTGRVLALGGHPAADVSLAPITTDTALWDVADPAEPVPVGTLPDALGPAQFSADGQTITTVPSRGDMHRPQVWRRTDGRWATLPTDDDQVGNYVAESVSEDGSLVTAVSSDLKGRASTLWRIRDGRLHEVDTVSAAPAAAAPALDSHGSAAGVEADTSIAVWRIDDGESPRKDIGLTDAPAGADTVFFRPDGDLVAVGDTAVAIWTMRPDVVAAAICMLSPIDLVSQARWDSYFPGLDVPMPCGDHHG
ncbi:MAG TPA: NACHT and WD repeat domain-containing protein [Kutzneria sp.]